MDKLKVVLIGTDAILRAQFRSALPGDDFSVMGSFEPSHAEKAVSLRPDALILFESDGVFELITRIYENLPGCPVLLCTKEMRPELIEKAMLSGIRGVFHADEPAEHIANRIRLAVTAEQARARSTGRPVNTRGVVVTVFSGKGGVGKTTVTVNVASALARMGKRVAVVDADLQFGDVALMLDLEPKDTIAELVQEQGGLDADTVKSFCMLHHTGVNVLCAPKSPECADYITPRHIETILGNLRTAFDYIIVDTPPSFNDTTLAAIECSDRVLLVAGVDISTLKNARACVGTFVTLQQSEKLRVLINCEQPSMISAKDVSKLLELPLFARIRNDGKTALTCLNRGSPAVCSEPRSRLAKELINLAEKIVHEFTA